MLLFIFLFSERTVCRKHILFGEVYVCPMATGSGAIRPETDQ